MSHNAHRPIMGLQIQSKKPYNKQLINLERSVFTRKSQTSAIRPIQKGLELRFLRKNLTLSYYCNFSSTASKPPQYKIIIPFFVFFFLKLRVKRANFHQPVSPIVNRAPSILTSLFYAKPRVFNVPDHR